MLAEFGPSRASGLLAIATAPTISVLKRDSNEENRLEADGVSGCVWFLTLFSGAGRLETTLITRRLFDAENGDTRPSKAT